MRLTSFDQRLQSQRDRRDRALAHLQGAQVEFRADANKRIAQWDPAAQVRAHPWGAVLAAFGVGVGLMALLKWLRTREVFDRQPPVTVGGESQRVVVEVAGAHSQAPKNLWMQSLFEGLPVVLAWLQGQALGAEEKAEAGEGGAGDGRSRSGLGESGTVPASISRRRASPPTE